MSALRKALAELPEMFTILFPATMFFVLMILVGAIIGMTGGGWQFLVGSLVVAVFYVLVLIVTGWWIEWLDERGRL